jgi:uncharacterized protein YndB with AHSA1/START domain
VQAKPPVRPSVLPTLRPNEIELIRVYEAPVKVVWDAWTDLQQVEQWWGPRGFTVTTKSKDLQPNGKWLYTMHGPDGTAYPNITTYHVVLKYEKLVYDHGGNDEREKLFTVSVTFKENQGKTTMRMVYTLPNAEEAKKTKHLIKQANGHSTWDRLGEFLENKIHGKDSFMITRSFATNLSSMFDMWINPQSFSSWCSMTTDDGQTKHGKINYLKISAPSTLIYTQNFCNKDILTTVLLTEEAPTQTRVAVKWEVHGESTEVERKTFHDMKSQMTAGWNSSFDKIDVMIGL